MSIKGYLREIPSRIGDYHRILGATNLPRVTVLMLLALLIGGAAIMLVEGQTGSFSNFFALVLWVLVTMTTVGYGDMVPITPVGRVVAVVIIDEIAAGKVDELSSYFEPLKLKIVRGDWTHEEVLRRAKVVDVKMVIILPDDKRDDTLKMGEKTILATLTVKGLNPKIRLMAHIMQHENQVFLLRAKADEVIVSDEYTGFLLATNTITTGVPEMIGELLSFEGDNHLIGVEIPPEFVGSTFLDLLNHFLSKGSILIGLAKEENPLEATDLLSADTSALDEFILRKFQEAGLGASRNTRPRASLNPPHKTLIDKQDKAVLIQSDSSKN